MANAVVMVANAVIEVTKGVSGEAKAVVKLVNIVKYPILAFSLGQGGYVLQVKRILLTSKSTHAQEVSCTIRRGDKKCISCSN